MDFVTALGLTIGIAGIVITILIGVGQSNQLRSQLLEFETFLGDREAHLLYRLDMIVAALQNNDSGQGSRDA